MTKDCKEVNAHIIGFTNLWDYAHGCIFFQLYLPWREALLSLNLLRLVLGVGGSSQFPNTEKEAEPDYLKTWCSQNMESPHLLTLGHSHSAFYIASVEQIHHCQAPLIPATGSQRQAALWVEGQYGLNSESQGRQLVLCFYFSWVFARHAPGLRLSLQHCWDGLLLLQWWYTSFRVTVYTMSHGTIANK